MIDCRGDVLVWCDVVDCRGDLLLWCDMSDRWYRGSDQQQLLEGLPDLLSRPGAHFQVPDTSLLYGFLHVLQADLPRLLQVALVAEQHQLDIGDGVLVDLVKAVATSLSQ